MLAATWHARAGRLTDRKRWALDVLGSRHRFVPDALDPATSPITVEIGAGTGEAAVALARRGSGEVVVATEVHRASVANLLLAVHAAQLANVVVAAADGRLVLGELAARHLPVARVRAFFPDPWPKRRHRGRRLITPSFLDLVAGALAPGGRLELCTDDPGYARAMAATLAADARFGELHRARADRPVTYYERRALDAGRPVVDLCARLAPAVTEEARP